jgi:IS5 family transposase
LQATSTLLDRYPEIAQLAHTDLTGGKRTTVGRDGMTGEQVIRVALLKQMHGLSYRALAFHLEDSAAFQAFARMPFGRRIKWTTLQMNVKRLRAETWEALNRVLLQFARTQRLETGQTVRVDTTTVEANIHEPSDSSLLWDCVRVVTRLLQGVADDLPAAHVPFTDHTRRAKRRAYALKFPPRGTRREGHLRWAYGDLLKVTKKVCGYGQATRVRLDEIANTNGREALRARGLAAELTGFVDSMARVISQTERRVFQSEKVPTAEKLLSIFETHTTVLVKGERDVVFGHKVCLTGGGSLILDCVIEDGNPADATLVERSIQRQVAIYGAAPRQASFDGGFASKANLQIAKDLGVQDVAFHTTCGLTIPDMVSSASVFRRLVRFRTGIEGCISALKRGYCMNRCTWRHLPSFRSYVWACVVCFNLVSIARRLPV